MKKIFLLLFLGFLAVDSHGQDSQCAMVDADDPKLVRPYVGNNRFLLDVLKEHGISLPDDYYEKLDEKGLYLGRA